jgi:hypothetical protein
MTSELTQHQISELAATAVERRLFLDAVIASHEPDFFETLVGAHLHAKKVLPDNSATFFAEVIPWVASLIQLFVKQSDFLEAIEWAKDTFDTPKPISILTVLTTTYLIQRGYSKARGTSQEALWRELVDRLGILIAAEREDAESC